MSTIHIALPKGRILKDSLQLFKRMNIIPKGDMFSSRELVFSTNHQDINFLLLRNIDVITYVNLAIADVGIVGKDLLMEDITANYYNCLDLQIGKCRLVTARIQDDKKTPMINPQFRLRVASKYPRTSVLHYAKSGIQAQVIKLNGAMELAPKLGIADEIIDIVETGKTLQANGLTITSHVADISTRLIINKASMKTRFEQLEKIVKQLQVIVSQKSC